MASPRAPSLAWASASAALDWSSFASAWLIAASAVFFSSRETSYIAWARSTAFCEVAFLGSRSCCRSNSALFLAMTAVSCAFMSWAWEIEPRDTSMPARADSICFTDASTFPPAWSSCARAWSRLAWYVRGSISSSSSPARTNWLSRIGSATIGPDTRGAIWITLACTWPSRVQGFSR